jgi:hypothetical protein
MNKQLSRQPVSLFFGKSTPKKSLSPSFIFSEKKKKKPLEHKWTLRGRKVSLETRIETPPPHEIGFSLLPHVLGPGYE